MNNITLKLNFFSLLFKKPIFGKSSTSMLGFFFSPSRKLSKKQHLFCDRDLYAVGLCKEKTDRCLSSGENRVKEKIEAKGFLWIVKEKVEETDIKAVLNENASGKEINRNLNLGKSKKESKSYNLYV